jgi:hypothetical protein
LHFVPEVTRVTRVSEGEDFGVLNAQALLRVWNFRFDFAAPLRINLARLGLRERDWDEARDFARIPQWFAAGPW